MDCKEYLSRFSEFMDGMTEADLSNEMEAHRSTCPGCDRYSATLETGRSLLQSLPSLDVPPDFRPRLDHRIFHLADGASIAPEPESPLVDTAKVVVQTHPPHHKQPSHRPQIAAGGAGKHATTIRSPSAPYTADHTYRMLKTIVAE